MAITVSDIEQKEFAFKGAGYDPYDVDSYLDQICDEMIALQDRVSELEAELKQANAKVEAAEMSVKPIPQTVEPVQKASETLEGILLKAQAFSEQEMEAAKKRAEELLKEAEGKASHVLGNVQEEKSTLEKEIKGLKVAAADYKKRFLNLINEHKALLEVGEPWLEEDEDDAE